MVASAGRRSYRGHAATAPPGLVRWWCGREPRWENRGSRAVRTLARRCAVAPVAALVEGPQPSGGGPGAGAPAPSRVRLAVEDPVQRSGGRLSPPTRHRGARGPRGSWWGRWAVLPLDGSQGPVGQVLGLGGARGGPSGSPGVCSPLRAPLSPLGGRLRAVPRTTNKGRRVHSWPAGVIGPEGALVSTCARCGLTKTTEEIVHRGVIAVAETTRLPSGRVIKAWCSPHIPAFRSVKVPTPECPGSVDAWASWQPVDREV